MFSLIFFFVIGAIFGSFANVVIYRWPKGESVVSPRSRCSSCQKPIAWYDNIPILSWFILRGKCRHCHAKYSFRYVVVEFFMGVMFAALAYVTPESSSSSINFTLIEYLIFVFGLITASVIDLDHMLLPDVITLPGVVIGLIGAYLNPDRVFLDAVFGVLLGGGCLWLVAYLYFLFRKQEGMGGGDIKLLAWIGAVLGWKAIPFVILAGSLSGSVVGILASFKQKKGLKTVIPFGPWLALGSVLYIFCGSSFGQWYWTLLFPAFN